MHFVTSARATRLINLVSEEVGSVLMNVINCRGDWGLIDDRVITVRRHAHGVVTLQAGASLHT